MEVEMMDIMEIARLSNSLDEDEITKEIFNVVKTDPKLVAEILKNYSASLVEDVQMIRSIVLNYHGHNASYESDQQPQEIADNKE
jgi:hypothetical protein